MRPREPKAHDNQVVDTLKIRDGEYKRILGKLDHEAGTGPPMTLQQRTQPRYPHAVVFVIRIHHPGGTCVNYVGRTRNISRTGLAFLHGNFLHSGTRCVISLPMREGKWMRMTGSIVRCRHVESKVHELGVHFDEPIELNDIIQASDETAAALTLPFGLGRYLKPV